MYHADLFCKGILLKYLISHVTLSTAARSNRCLLHLRFVWKNVSYMENFLMGIVVEHSWDIRRPWRARNSAESLPLIIVLAKKQKSKREIIFVEGSRGDRKVPPKCVRGKEGSAALGTLNLNDV